MFWILIGLLGLFAILEIISLLVRPSPFGDMAFIFNIGVVCVGVAVVSLLISPSRLSRNAAKNENLVTELKWSLSDEEIIVTARNARSVLPWSTFSSFTENEEYFLLLSAANKNSFQIIPKRSFAGDEDQTAFRELLKRRLARK
jgi:hypothetical protein